MNLTDLGRREAPKLIDAWIENRMPRAGERGSIGENYYLVIPTELKGEDATALASIVQEAIGRVTEKTTEPETSSKLLFGNKNIYRAVYSEPKPLVGGRPEMSLRMTAEAFKNADTPSEYRDSVPQTKTYGIQTFLKNHKRMILQEVMNIVGERISQIRQ